MTNDHHISFNPEAQQNLVEFFVVLQAIEQERILAERLSINPLPHSLHETDRKTTSPAT